MNREDLLRLLDLSGTAAQETETDAPITQPKSSAPNASASPTALELDDWALRKGRQLLVDNNSLRELRLDEHAVADFHGAAFEPAPRLQPDCADPQRRAFLEQLLQTPDFHSLHTVTMLNGPASTLAAVAFAEQFSELRKEDESANDETEQGMAQLRAAGRALLKATEDVEEMRDAAAALGMGPGAPGSNDPGTIAALYRRVRNNRTLRHICELAGRYRRVAQSCQRRKTVHGQDDMVGVLLDGNIGQMLPYELAKLTIAEFEDDFLRRLVERQVMCRDYRAFESVAKGPIIVCVDESGSMEGEKVHTAKALALAMAWIARHQNRWCALCAYSGDSGERLLALPPGRWDETALLDWLDEFLGHGSSLDVPVREMPRMYETLQAPRGDTDLLFITDAICHIPADIQKGFLGWKEQVQARLITLVIDSSPGDLTTISDEVHHVDSLAVEEAAVERVLSL